MGAGAVSGIVSDFKKNLQASDIDSTRELAIDAKRQGLKLIRISLTFQTIQLFYQIGGSRRKNHIIHRYGSFCRHFPRKTH
jgi:hypothetical protein